MVREARHADEDRGDEVDSLAEDEDVMVLTGPGDRSRQVREGASRDCARRLDLYDMRFEDSPTAALQASRWLEPRH